MRDLAVLFLHLLATVARLAGPGGARSVVAESVLVKHQLLILNRSRKRSPNLRPADRVVAGLCAVFIRPGRLIRSAIVFKPSTLLNLHRALIQRKYRRLFSSKSTDEAGPQGAQPGRHRRCRRHETAEPELGVSTDRAADHAGLRHSHRQGCGATDSGGSVPAEARLRGAVLADRPGSCEGQSVECGSVSVRIGRPPHVLGARRDGPLDAAHRGFRRAPWRRGRGGAVPDVQSRDVSASPCRPTSVRTMIRCTGFISGRRTCGSSTSGKSRRCRTCRAPIPVVERLIGTVRRECLDRLLFWTAADLERKLLEFQQYYNEHRTHAGRAGCPPAPSPDDGRRSGESSSVSVAATLSWAVSHADCSMIYQRRRLERSAQIVP